MDLTAAVNYGKLKCLEWIPGRVYTAHIDMCSLLMVHNGYYTYIYIL